ncbi:MAG: transcription-repair coupling factor [Candidatus Melainabacteria bacterium]|nr:transcription-repair coupling factor [Candidatus Melainabacteria bacterium]
MLLDLIQQNNKFAAIYSKLNKDGQIIHGLTNSAKSLMLANLVQRSQSPIIFVVANHHEAQTYYQEIKNLSNKPVFNFLCQEVSPYDQINSDITVTSSQYEIFDSWQSGQSSLTVMNIKALAQLYIKQKLFEENSFFINSDTEIDPQNLAQKLTLLGYNNEAMVEGRGQFSHRGDILDIYPITGEAARLEFFGDNIESIKTLNTNSQRSSEPIEFVHITPRYSIIRSEDDGLSQKLEELAAKHQIEDLIAQDSLYFEGVEYYRSLLGQEASSLFDYIPANIHLVLDEWQDLTNLGRDWNQTLIDQYQEGVKNHKLIPLETSLHLDQTQLIEQVNECKRKLYLQTMVEAIDGSSDQISYEILSHPAERFASKVEEFIEYMRKKLREKQNIVIFSEQPHRVLNILREWDINALYQADLEAVNIVDLAKEDKGKVIVQRDGLEEGCLLPELNIVILTDRELFGRSRQAVAKQKTKKSEAGSKREIYTDISELKVDDYVVHYKHGVGKYKGTEFIELDGGSTRQEYLAIEYADEARILIPVDQVNLLSRFNINQEIKPKLSKLGGTDWERTKKKVKKSVRAIAQDLINLYALREKQTGYKYPHDTPWQIEMEDAFPYTETEDQLKAIDEVKQDMETSKLMDRLICGDAGFGKTEVILRAAFKTIMEGKQVAILVPTTVLAQQHHDTFSDRFAAYPIRIGLLSRFRTAKEQREVVNKLKLGELDLVIGTHRLLQKDIQFQNIGLLVIDEEQRFGVSHKEKLKSMRKDLDVISMSATPIPRTLHMSLSGIRDISLIGTPPTNRKPVKTFVGEYKNNVMRNAILHELERGGQVFFVHNRVENIDQVAHEVQQLVPEAAVRVGHGQMKDKELEDVMFAFVNHEFNVFVCTTIIETGLDIANANTIIIRDANAFGLSQLYQLRGRVGRSDLQAYAYLLYNPENEISAQARERLRAIRELTNLGSGYQISIRDMEIRGVGNIFGAEQHGHMLSVGFDLYCKILSDTIEEMKGNVDAIELEDSCTIDIKVNAYFPENWISNIKQRMNEYKRLSLARDEATLDHLSNEWRDRFGRLPQEALNLIDISRIKIRANKAKIGSINQEGDSIKIANKLRLQQWLQSQRKLPAFLQSRINFKAGAVGARSSDSMISVKVSGLDTESRLTAVKDIIELLA